MLPKLASGDTTAFILWLAEQRGITVEEALTASKSEKAETLKITR